MPGMRVREPEMDGSVHLRRLEFLRRRKGRSGARIRRPAAHRVRRAGGKGSEAGPHRRGAELSGQPHRHRHRGTQRGAGGRPRAGQHRPHHGGTGHREIHHHHPGGFFDRAEGGHGPLRLRRGGRGADQDAGRPGLPRRSVEPLSAGGDQHGKRAGGGQPAASGFPHHRLHPDHVLQRSRICAGQRVAGAGLRQPADERGQGHGYPRVRRGSCYKERRAGRTEDRGAYGGYGAPVYGRTQPGSAHPALFKEPFRHHL